MNKNNHYTFLLLKPSTQRKVGIFRIKNIADKIIKYIEKYGFKIIAQKKIQVSNTDILRLYKEDINSVKKENSVNAKKMFRGYQSTLKKDYCVLLLLFHPDGEAKDHLSRVKGHHFNPSKCNHNTIRYLFRNKIWDDFSIQSGEIADTLPDDNVVHAPRDDTEFFPIINKYLKKEWDNLKK